MARPATLLDPAVDIQTSDGLTADLGVALYPLIH